MLEITGIVIGAGRYPDGAVEINIRGGHEDSRIPSLVMQASIKRYWPEAPVINTYDLEKPRLTSRKNPTPFSLVRHMVPKLCGFRGWGVYVDADQIVFDDMRKMLRAVQNDPNSPQNVLYRSEANGCTGVVLMNCELLNWDAWHVRDKIDSGKLDYSDAQRNMQSYGKIGDLGIEWNTHDNQYQEGKTKLLHFTNLGTQPWKFPGKHPQERVWAKSLRQAIDEGYLTEDELDQNCRMILRNHEAVTA